MTRINLLESENGIFFRKTDLMHEAAPLVFAQQCSEVLYVTEEYVTTK